MKIVSRKEARDQGLARYYTGKPCKHGHTTERRTDNKTCLGCDQRKRKERQAYHTAWAREWHKRNPHKAREYAGLPEPTRPMPETCECCGGPPGKQAMHLDHSHFTGQFRGWLCNRCNLGIGLLGDHIGAVLRAVEYLKRSFEVDG